MNDSILIMIKRLAQCVQFKQVQIVMQDKNQDIEDLRQWMVKAGCKIHPAVDIPAYFNGVQGVGTKQSIPHKTVIIAIPSHLVITVPRCYNDPILKPIFKANDDLFDYEAEEDAEFNILTVFLMYNKLNIETSPWKAYLKTIAKPETAVDWPEKDLVGLNKSLIQEILHVKRQCKKVEKQICIYLKKTKIFAHLADQQLLQLFRICYPSVLTRCFGYYFSSACMIPIADLMNHSCHSIDHQLVHLNFEKGVEFYEGYNERSHKIDCNLLGLPKPKPEKVTYPTRLQFLLKNKLIQNDLQVLNKLKRQHINERIYKFLQQKFKQEETTLGQMDFCEEDDDEDNDTEEEEGINSEMGLHKIQEEERQQMALFKQHFQHVKIERYADVEKRMKQQLGEEDDKATQCTPEKKQTQPNLSQTEEKVVNDSIDLKEHKKGPQVDEQKVMERKQSDKKDQKSKETEEVNNNGEKVESQIKKKLPPIQYVASSSSEEECSEEEEWCLDKSCYFAISTDAPVEAGAQLFNSYGSRTNKFLIVWYGFTYRDNLFDSVTLRLQALFSEKRPQAKDIVLDTYVGGQGLFFKKNQHDVVRPEQVSKQFRLKRTRLPRKLMIFLRLYLLNFYQGEDAYKLFVTFPSSVQFEIYLLNYLRDIVESIYSRYEIITIETLKEVYNDPHTDPQVKIRTNYKIIYLQEQRKILDANMKGIEAALKVMKKLKSQKKFTKNVLDGVQIEMIRYLREYMLQVEYNFEYMLYEKKQKMESM